MKTDGVFDSKTAPLTDHVLTEDGVEFRYNRLAFHEFGDLCLHVLHEKQSSDSFTEQSWKENSFPT
jgi:hypothetical protein